VSEIRIELRAGPDFLKQRCDAGIIRFRLQKRTADSAFHSSARSGRGITIRRRPLIPLGAVTGAPVAFTCAQRLIGGLAINAFPGAVHIGQGSRRDPGG